jgi:hypothetical protein
MMLSELALAHAVDILGAAACGATLLTFAQKRMWPMRISAVIANLFFIGYGALALLYPVLFLHLVLLPLNVARLIQLAQRTPEAPQLRHIGLPSLARTDQRNGILSAPHRRELVSPHRRAHV